MSSSFDFSESVMLVWAPPAVAGVAGFSGILSNIDEPPESLLSRRLIPNSTHEVRKPG
jgi:hypothetical protein